MFILHPDLIPPCCKIVHKCKHKRKLQYTLYNDISALYSYTIYKHSERKSEHTYSLTHCRSLITIVFLLDVSFCLI